MDKLKAKKVRKGYAGDASCPTAVFDLFDKKDPKFQVEITSHCDEDDPKLRAIAKQLQRLWNDFYSME
jgi:hypothetical protein